MRVRIFLAAAAASLAWRAAACTTVMVGKNATTDGSVLVGSSCDGDIMGVMYVMPAETRPASTVIPMYRNMPRPRNHAEYLANLRKGYDVVGRMPLGSTYRTILLGGQVESMMTGGMNEYGLTVAIEFIPMRKGLASAKGRVGPNSKPLEHIAHRTRAAAR